MKAHYLMVGLIVFLCASQRTPAQTTNFDLRNYKTTDYERSSFDLGFNFSEATNNENKSENTIDYVYDVKSHYLRGNLDGTYSKIILNRKKYLNTGFSLNTSYNGNSSESDRIDLTPNYYKSENTTYSTTIKFFQNSEHYYSNSKNKFWEYNVSAEFEMNGNSNYKETDTVQDNSKYFRTTPINLSIYVGHGHGRLEFVEDAIEAVYILNELNSKGIISAVNANEVKLLADEITRVKKRRYMDNRLYRQEVMTELIRFFRDNDLAEKESVELYNTVNDYHFLAGIQQRKSGSKLEYGITPEFSLYNEYIDGSHLYSKRREAMRFNVRYENQVPINIHWQKGFVSEISSYIGKNEYKNSGEFENRNFEIEGLYWSNQYNIGYYPNTRTNFTASVYCNMALWASRLLTSGMNFSAYYYLSENLRLNGSLNVYGYYDRDEHMTSNSENQDFVSIVNSGHKFNQSFTISLSYYIF